MKEERGRENLTKNEQYAVELCREVQKLCKTLGKNLPFDDIRECSTHLVCLYKLRRIMDEARGYLPKTPVFDNRTGKYLGSLYENRYIEGVMMSTNIGVNSAIQHTEWHIQMITRRYTL